jgi:hypothetical protein
MDGPEQHKGRAPELNHDVRVLGGESFASA